MAANSVIIPLAKRVGYVRVVKVRYVWPISYESGSCDGLGQAQTSPIFSPQSDNDLKWRMNMYLGGADESNFYNISLYVCFVPSTKYPEVRAKYKLSLLGRCDKILTSREISNTQTFTAGLSGVSGFDDFVNRLTVEAQLGYQRHKKFKIVCEIKAVLKMSDIPETGPLTSPEYRFPGNLRNIFESKKFSDVTLIICGQAFRAHKVILAMHSPVFSAMFEHETMEQVNDEVKITDVTPEVFNEMLRFMYTGEVTGIEKIADFLLVAADKYDLEKLKAMCEKALSKNIVVNNAADILILADKHNAKQLKTAALKFMATLTTDVMATSGFQSITESHPHLVVELLRALATRKNEESQELMLFAIEEGSSNLQL